MTPPRKLPAFILTGNASQGFGQTIAIGTTHPQIGFAVGSQLVRLVKDNEIVGNDLGFLEAREHAIPRQGVHTYNEQIAARTNERVAESRIAAGHDSKGKIEQAPHLMLPVAYQSSRRRDKDARDEPTTEHFTDI